MASEQTDPSVKQVLDASGFPEPNPVQKKALDSGLLSGRNMVLAAPTASGKTLVAEMAAFNTIRKGKKVIYIVPLRALASEKYDDFRDKYEKIGVRVAISIGDLDRSDPWLARYDIVIMTSEKLDSLLRRGIPWLEDVGLVITDEVHLLDSPNRGPTLEIVLTRLRQVSNPAILALSATISNHEELAEWLDATPVKSTWRPVKLFSGICFDGSVDFQPKRALKLASPETPLRSLIDDTLQKGKQALVFVNTRRGTESAAEKIGAHIKKRLGNADRKNLRIISEEIMEVLEKPTAQCRRLAACVASSTAFHHAGLPNKQRSIIEKRFKEGAIKVIFATPTLAAGINLPAYRVIIRDLKRFSSFKGMDFMPVLEVQQMAGRAGRPAFDNEGEAVLLPKNRAEAEYAWENYIKGEPEKIYSKLGVEPVLRTHVLALISSGATYTKKDLMDFFFRTFYAHQYKDLTRIEGIINKVIGMLKEYGFVQGNREVLGEWGDSSPFKPASCLLQKENEKLLPTRIGKRVAELYLDPLTAHHIIKGLEYAKNKQAGLQAFQLFHLVSNTMEMRPLMSMRKKDQEEIEEVLTRKSETCWKCRQAPGT